MHVRRISDIGRHHVRFAAFIGDDFACRFGGLEIQIATEYLRSLPGQQCGDGLAVTPSLAQRAATCHQGHFPIQSEHINSLTMIGHATENPTGRQCGRMNSVNYLRSTPACSMSFPQVA